MLLVVSGVQTPNRLIGESTMSNEVITWADALKDEKHQPYFIALLKALDQEQRAGKIIYPPKNQWFQAFKATPYDQVKVVLLGQDPYHGPGQAHGLAFSVQPGVKPPPSLNNIFRELNADLNRPITRNGCLSQWAQQGVLLLNTSLTVEQGKPQSHAKLGWATFTDTVIRQLDRHPRPLVFLLWGAHAQSKRSLLQNKNHLILTAPHPSPLSAYQGFLGCGHFSKANAFLRANGQEPIHW